MATARNVNHIRFHRMIKGLVFQLIAPKYRRFYQMVNAFAAMISNRHHRTVGLAHNKYVGIDK